MSPRRLLLLLALVACRTGPQPITQEMLEGLAQREGDSVSLAWPATQLRVQFRGSWLTAQLTETPNPDPDRTPSNDRLQLRVDDRAPIVLALQPGTQTYTLASGLDAERTHRVQLWKLSEAEVGTVRIAGLETDGELVAQRVPEAPLLEAVGDSITVGYGATASSVACADHVPFTDSAQSYTAVAARELGFGYRALAYSGRGLLRNYDPRKTEPLPMLYGRALPLDPASSLHRAPRAADVIVLNLGTNDFARGVPDAAAFRAALEQLVAQIRRRNGRAWLVLALGPMLTDDHPVPQARTTLRQWLTAARDALHASGDARVAMIELWTDPAEGFGCDYHPSQRTHARLGRELAALIARLR